MSNSAPKNSEKIINYTESKYPHNNHSKINHIFYKKIQNISKPKNNKKMFNTHIKNLSNILENNSSSEDKNIIESQEIDDFDLNKYVNQINKNGVIKNNINLDSDRDYVNTYNNINTNVKIYNQKKINDKLIIKKNNKNLNREFYLKENTQTFDVMHSFKNQLFDSITINNNNSINLHEPKLFIYVENNNNSINNKIEDLKAITQENIMNKPKMLIKLDKKKYKISKLSNPKNMNNPVVQAKKLLNKRAVIHIIDGKINNKIQENNRYITYNSNDNKKDKTINVYKDYNKNLLDIFKKNKAGNKRIFNEIDNTKNNNILFNSNDKIFDSLNKSKAQNIDYINNKNTNTINNYYNNINNINNINYNNFNNLNNKITSTITATNHSSKNKNLWTDKDENICQNLYNFVKVDNNNKDFLNYEKEKVRIKNNKNKF